MWYVFKWVRWGLTTQAYSLTSLWIFRTLRPLQRLDAMFHVMQSTEQHGYLGWILNDLMNEFIDLPVQLLTLLTALSIMVPVLWEAGQFPDDGELITGKGIVGLRELRKRTYLAFAVLFVLRVGLSGQVRADWGGLLQAGEISFFHGQVDNYYAWKYLWSGFSVWCLRLDEKCLGWECLIG